MPRPPEARWSRPENCWVSDVGDVVTDASGRKRRKRVYFRADEHGPIPFGGKPRSEGYRRAAAALRLYLESSRVATVVGAVTAAQVCKLYLDHCRDRVARQKLKPRSLEVVRQALAMWADWPDSDPIGHRWAHRVTAADLKAFMAGRVGTEGHYARRVVTTIRAAWAWALDEGHLAANPLASVRRPTGPPRTGRRPDRQVFRRWFRAAWAKARSEPRHRRVNRVTLLLLRAIADTGARPEELCLARWSDLDRRLLLIAPHDHKTAGHRKQRMILFPRRWARVLAHLERTGHPTFVFAHGQHRAKKAGSVRLGDELGEPWNPHALGVWARRWGMPCTRYDLRRLVASELADAGLDYRRIADLLGNSPAIVQSVYAKRSAESLRAELDRLDGRSSSP